MKAFKTVSEKVGIVCAYTSTEKFFTPNDYLKVFVRRAFSWH
jgi:hypothetical protein